MAENETNTAFVSKNTSNKSYPFMHEIQSETFLGIVIINKPTECLFCKLNESNFLKTMAENETRTVVTVLIKADDNMLTCHTNYVFLPSKC